MRAQPLKLTPPRIQPEPIIPNKIIRMNRIGKIYTPKTLADELKVPIRHVFRAIRQGQLRCAKISPAVFRLEGEDVDRWMQSMKKS